MSRGRRGRGVASRHALLTLWVLGCGASPPVVVEEEAVVAMPDDALGARMARLATALAPRGFEARIRGRGFLAERDARTRRLTLPAGECFAIVAVTSPTVRDLDLAVYDPDGGFVAEDVQPDAHPAVQLCSGETPREVVLHLAAYAGAGPFLYVAFAAPREALPAVAEVLGGRPGVERPGDPRRAELESTLQRRGFVLERARDLRVDAEQVVRAAFPLRRGRCYTAVALPHLEGGVSLTLRSGDGGAHAADQGAATVALQYCAERDDPDAYAEVVAGERGTVDVLRWVAEATRIGGRASLWLERRVPPEIDGAEGWALEWDERLSLRPAAVALRELDVPEGRCARVEVGADVPVALRVRGEDRGRRAHVCEAAPVGWVAGGQGEGRWRATTRVVPEGVPAAVLEGLLDAGWDGEGTPRRIESAVRVDGCERWWSSPPVVTGRVCDAEVRPSTETWVVRRAL